MLSVDKEVVTVAFVRLCQLVRSRLFAAKCDESCIYKNSTFIHEIQVQTQIESLVIIVIVYEGGGRTTHSPRMEGCGGVTLLILRSFEEVR